jgi:micrococcal nuclease
MGPAFLKAPMADHYIRAAKLIRVIDGDTLVMQVDLGMRIFKECKLRLGRVNAEEMSTPQGVKRKASVEEWFSTKANITIETTKDRTDKYDRYIAEVSASDSTGKITCLNDWLLTNGCPSYA